MATLFTPTDLEPEFDRLFEFVQNMLEIARRFRVYTTDPASADAFTMEQADPVVERDNVEAVFEQFQRMKDLILKVDDAMSEGDFALNFGRDVAFRRPPLDETIHGPDFNVVKVNP